MADLERIAVEDLEEIGGRKMLLNIDQANTLSSWVTENSSHIQRLLAENGALLIRGMVINGSKQLGHVLSHFLGGELLEYKYRSTPRTQMRNGIYTSTEYPANEKILLHNENSYSNRWPLAIGFYCNQPAEDGGETPIADNREVYTAIPDEIKSIFNNKEIVIYARDYSTLDLPWSEVFQTNNREDVENYCRDNAIEFKWDGEDLQTRQLNPVVRVHPVTGEKVWFNQVHLFHPSSLRPELKRYFKTAHGDKLPRNVFFSDGSLIGDDIVAEIINAYEKRKVIFSWEKDDLLLLDNMRYSHGREAFSGHRKVLVGMARPMSDPTDMLA